MCQPDSRRAAYEGRARTTGISGLVVDRQGRHRIVAIAPLQEILDAI